MQTKLVRVDLTNIPTPTITVPAPLEALVDSASTTQGVAGLRLVSTFVFETDLVLIFQK